MFESLTDRFNDVFRKLSGRGRLTEENVSEALREVRIALLEADVHLDVVRKFIDQVREDAVGREVTKSLKPGEEMVGIVHQRLVDLMGGGEEETQPAGVLMVDPPPTVIMMCGLQGSGKTTTCGKLASWLRRRGRSVLVAAADLQRPAAVEQLETVVRQVDADSRGQTRVDFYGEPERVAEYGQAVGVAVGVCQRAYDRARRERYDALILDTAGRLHVNDELMQELEGINRAVNPHQIFLVVDAMTGQDAVNSAKEFHQRLEIDGVILTKLDSDTRGGAALSVREVTGAPVRFVGVGERWDALEEFHAERMAGRILGMGDVVSLVEKAQQEVTEEEAEKMAERMEKGQLTLDDFLKQLRSLRRMGPLKQLMGLLPGVGSALKGLDVDDRQLDRLEGIVHSMTPAERKNIKLLNKSRSKRIAAGSGTKPEEVNRLTKQFEMIQKMTRQLSGAGVRGKMQAMKDMASLDPAAMGGGAFPDFGKGSTATKSPKTRFKRRKKRR